MVFASEAGSIPNGPSKIGLPPKTYSPPEVDRMWLWVYQNKIPKYPIFYLLKGDCSSLAV